jgi:ankyrin repeat protein
LIELGADANLGDDHGYTPLHCAAGHGFYAEAVEMAEALLTHGADINARSPEFGFVPLHEATGAGMIRLLVSRGADAGVRSNAGLTPLEYMIEEDRSEDAEHLRQSLRLE